ncbi:hypothetical protein C1645_739362 [Glomus cerebriforme]|uniref:DUF659 domain-containing protein n=1 Tax=Glomus cerebriforme TaxID=658196 RepID=A0A397SWW3_9GLOM|nr:hypothetical protein C1645_739362 [Glomus cerebriforme]
MVNFILTNEKRQSQIWKVENFSNIHHTGDIMFNAYKKDLEIGGKVLTLPCMAHQTNLLVKKIVKSYINHFRNSNLALAKLWELSQNPNLTPEYPCITRWETFSKAAKSILSIRDNIRVNTEFVCRLFSIPSNSATSEKGDDIDNVLGDGVVVDAIMNNLEQTSAKIIDDISIFDSNNDVLQPPTLLEIFDSQLIETALTNFIL